jgi:hypothetical protein
MLLAVGLPMLVIYVIGLPLVVFIGLYRSKEVVSKLLKHGQLGARNSPTPAPEPVLTPPRKAASPAKVGVVSDLRRASAAALAKAPSLTALTTRALSPNTRVSLTAKELFFEGNYGFLFAGSFRA